MGEQFLPFGLAPGEIARRLGELVEAEGGGEGGVVVDVGRIRDVISANKVAADSACSLRRGAFQRGGLSEPLRTQRKAVLKYFCNVE